MTANTLKGLSTACLVAGNLSMAASIALWSVGRVARDPVKQNDGLFVGLWVPTFYILADRLAVAALDHEERRALAHDDNNISGHETIQDRSGRGVLPTSREILNDEKNMDEPQQRATTNVNKSVSIGT